jgi:hypothetical protein
MTTETPTTATPSIVAPTEKPAEQHPRGIGKLALALAKAQGRFSNPPRNRSVTVNMKGGGSYSFNYADLAAVLEVVRQPLSENGLAIVQQVVQRQDDVFVRSILAHESGETLTQEIEVGSADMDIKELGGRITYMRRYVLSALLGIASEEDEDERHSGHRDSREEEPRKARERKSKGQQEAIQNQPKLQPGTERRKYQSERHVLIRDIAAKKWVEVKVDDIANEDLFGQHAACKERAEWHRGKGNADAMADADRDARILRERIDQLQLKMPDEAPATDAKTEAPAALSDAKDGGGNAVSPAQDGPAPAPAESSGLQSVQHAVRVPAELSEEQVKALRKTTQLDETEKLQVGTLTVAEIVAMLHCPANRDLFNPELAVQIEKANEHGLLPLTGEWLAGPWHFVHNMNSGRRFPMRQLLRTAIADCGLVKRLEDIQAGKGFQLGTVPASKEQEAAALAWLLAAANKDLPAAQAKLAKLAVASVGGVV